MNVQIPQVWQRLGDVSMQGREPSEVYLWEALVWEVSSELESKSQDTEISQEVLLQSIVHNFTNLYEGQIADQARSESVRFERSILNDAHIPGLASTWLTLLNDHIPRLTSQDRRFQYHPAEHRFRFAAWAASTAASASPKCRFPVELGRNLLRETPLRWLCLGEHWLPETREEFDHRHELWCEQVEDLGRNLMGTKFSYGIAAKLVNCYLKALFLQSMIGTLPSEIQGGKLNYSNRRARFIHPPIDRLLMNEAMKRSLQEVTKDKWRKLIEKGWSSFCKTNYDEAIQLCRELVGEEVALIEACWVGHQSPKSKKNEK